MELFPRLAKERSGMVVEAKLALGEKALGFLTGLSKRDDWVSADCDPTAFLPYSEHERFCRGADAQPEAWDSVVSIQALSVFGRRDGGNGAIGEAHAKISL